MTTTSETVLDRPPLPAAETTASTVRMPDTEPAAGTERLAVAHAGNLAAALDRDEAGRMRVFALVVCGIAILASAAVVILGGHPVAQAIHLAGAVAGGVAALVTYLLLRNGATYTARMNTLFGFAAVSAVASGYFYWGMYSAVLLLLPFGAFVFASTKTLGSALLITLPAYVLHGLGSVLIAVGLVPDHGLIRPVGFGLVEHFTVIAVTQGIFLAALVAARGARKSTAAAVRELERAVRALSLREQLLAETREELARALQLGGPGRYTDQELGNYRLGALIGRGAMGEVYRAQHRDSETEAAVKVLHADLLAEPGHLRRFLRELDLVAAIRSPHVVKVLETSSLDRGLPYLAMERLEGHTLAETLQSSGVLGGAAVVEMVQQVGKGLERAHAAGVIHRDLKPQNLFCTENGTWKILDFGVGTLVDHEGTLALGRIVGTPAYMSPEQVRGHAVDVASDRYGLAAVAYRALTGRSPASGKSMAAIVRAVAEGRPVRPTALRPTLPPDVDLALAIGLARVPAERFETCAELAGALARALDGALPAELRRRGLELDTFASDEVPTDPTVA